MSAIQSWTTHLSEYRRIDNQRWRAAVAAKQCELAARIVVDLDVHVGTVELSHACGGEVVCIARKIRQRQTFDDFEGRNIDSICRNRVIRKRCTQCGIGIRRWIVHGDSSAGEIDVSVGIRTQAERSYACRCTGSIPLSCTFKISEEEELVLSTPD